MTTYIIRRLLYTIPIVFGVLLLTFILFNLVGGDPAIEMAGKNATAETIAEIRAEYGLDKPLFFSWDSQFINHFKNALTFHFGRARDRELIADKILRGAGPSLSLTVPMFFGTVAISVSLSLVVAFLRGSRWDTLIVILCVAGMSLPYLSFILFGQYFLAYKFGWFPVFFSPDLVTAEYIALPVIIGIVAGLGGNLRFYRTVMLDEMKSDYVRTAFAKGLSTKRVLFKHVLKNAMVPIITQVVLAIPFLFLGSLLLERFFGIPGLGYLMVEAIGSRDYFVINAMTYISAVLFVVFNLVTDICYVLVDPRVSFD
ncbi:MAG TPA: ABC transporter permease [Planctomycetes bacterium]|nr:ABC transporter permease [Planctomycetota bacterium]HIJ71654.1 ABC transporter permease [Planctomycetota bacterium]